MAATRRKLVCRDELQFTSKIFCVVVVCCAVTTIETKADPALRVAATDAARSCNRRVVWWGRLDSAVTQFHGVFVSLSLFFFPSRRPLTAGAPNAGEEDRGAIRVGFLMCQTSFPSCWFAFFFCRMIMMACFALLFFIIILLVPNIRCWTSCTKCNISEYAALTTCPLWSDGILAYICRAIIPGPRLFLRVCFP